MARLAKFVRLHWRAYVDSLSEESLIHATAHRLLQMLLAAGQPVPAAVFELARVEPSVRGATEPIPPDR